PAVLRVEEMYPRERRLDRRVLLVEGPAAVVARHDGAELADHPEVVRVAIGHGVEVDVARVAAGGEGALGPLHLGRDLHRRPGATAVLGVDHGAEVTGAVAALAAGELEAEDVA